MLPRRQENRERHNHGTEETRKICRSPANGYIELDNEQIEKVSGPCPVKIQVKLI